MSHLVDSDCVADWLKGRQAAIDLLTGLLPNGLAISIITYGEIYEGIYYGRNRQRHERGFRQFLRLVKVLPITRKVAKRFAVIRGELRRRGSIIGDPDLLIGATALENDLTLVTRNRQHFQRIAGLNLYQESPSMT